MNHGMKNPTPLDGLRNDCHDYYVSWIRSIRKHLTTVEWRERFSEMKNDGADEMARDDDRTRRRSS